MEIGDYAFLPAPPMAMATVVMVVVATSTPTASVMAVASTMTSRTTATGQKHCTVLLLVLLRTHRLLHFLRCMFLPCQDQLDKNAEQQNLLEKFRE
ncbi:unnamed protein product [Schistocephalus solidus]|uniref:Secreted protein n=1 Tax=Schistocephalus solidus TaxID=70667 RepID=A0A183SC12_SCHSO|nr:unnamed protein product [Schistocephalus solidus]